MRHIQTPTGFTGIKTRSIRQQRLSVTSGLTSWKSISVLEMPYIGGDKSHAVLITAVDRIAVPHAATGMSNALDACLTCFLYGVIPRERKEGIRC